MIILRSGRSPFELYLLAACVLSGLSGLIAPSSLSLAVAQLLPTWVVTAWCAGLVIGGSISILGVLRRGLQSLLIERVGLIALTGLTLLYSVSIVTLAGPRATFAALFVAAFGAACVARFWQIGKDLTKADKESTRPPRGES